MATVEFLTKRIEGKEKEIAKLEKRLERILKAEETNWEVNPYWYRESDKKCTIRDIEAAKNKLQEYKDNLALEEKKNNSRNITVIIEFLENWKKRTTEYYEMSFESYKREEEEYSNKSSEYIDWWNKNFKERCTEAGENRTKEYKKYKKEFHRKWNWIVLYTEWKDGNYYLNRERLKKDLDREANVMYDDLVARVMKYTGEITDASYLSIGEKGELNGFIVGKEGKAKVETIDAGGYNIQCYHFRTLVHAMK